MIVPILWEFIVWWRSKCGSGKILIKFHYQNFKGRFSQTKTNLDYSLRPMKIVLLILFIIDSEYK